MRAHSQPRQAMLDRARYLLWSGLHPFLVVGIMRKHARKLCVHRAHHIACVHDRCVVRNGADVACRPEPQARVPEWRAVHGVVRRQRLLLHNLTIRFKHTLVKFARVRNYCVRVHGAQQVRDSGNTYFGESCFTRGKKSGYLLKREVRNV